MNLTIRRSRLAFLFAFCAITVAAAPFDRYATADLGSDCSGDPSGCGPCLACDGSTCVMPPDTCASALPTKSTVALIGNGDPAKRAARWKWRGTSSKAQFGTPTTVGGTGYALCVYDGNGAFVLLDVPPTCTTNACWAESARGFKLSSKGTPVKVRVKLTEGAPGTLIVKTKGTASGLPSLPLPLNVALRLLRKDNGTCWDAVYDTGIKTNTPTKFSANSN